MANKHSIPFSFIRIYLFLDIFFYILTKKVSIYIPSLPCLYQLTYQFWKHPKMQFKGQLKQV